MMIYTIDIDLVNVTYLIYGEINLLIQNKRLLISFKRLNFQIDNEKIKIPYRRETQVKTLQEIQSLLKKNNYTFQISDDIGIELSSFKKEEDNFEIFSQSARAIRNNDFKNNKSLILEFEKFQEVLSNTFSKNRTLYPLQLLSSFHMAFSQNSCNFSVPGSGKTTIVYGAYAFLRSLPKDDYRHVDKLVVVGPLSSFTPWETEFFECFGYEPNSFRMSGDKEISKKQKIEHLYSANSPELTLIFHGGVDRFQNEILDFLKNNKTMVVVDEAHRIKNPEGIWGRSVTEISKEAVSRVILTGTPIPNGYQDIFNLFKFIYPFKFREILRLHYHNLEDMTNNNSPESLRVEDLKNNISPYFVRVKKSDLNLPPVEENSILIEMDSYQKEIYDFIESKYLPYFKENNSATIKDYLNRAKLIRLRQASTNPSLLSLSLRGALENNELTGELDPNAIFTTTTDEFINDSEFFQKIINYPLFETPKKFKSILSLLLDEIFPSNGKVIIWTIFIENAKNLKTFLLENGIESKLLIGEIHQLEREETIAKFNNPSNNEFNVLIANPFSVAESISLHKGCHNAIYLERDYNCSNFIQSKDRIHRVGLDATQLTRYFYILSKDTIDEIIDNRLRVKIQRMEDIINSEIPLFNRVDNDDETDIINDLISNYAKRTQKI